jgi:hypothetical protein
MSHDGYQDCSTAEARAQRELLLCAANFNGSILHARLLLDTVIASASEMQAIGSS